MAVVPTPRPDGPAFVRAVTACLEQRGYEVSSDPDAWPATGFELVGGSAPADQFGDAMEDCGRDIDLTRMDPITSFTPTQFAELWAWVRDQALCMREAGYPASYPPPFDEYVADGASWDPYVDLRQRGIDFSSSDVTRCQSTTELPSFWK